jgi:hypothetical protein
MFADSRELIEQVGDLIAMGRASAVAQESR